MLCSGDSAWACGRALSVSGLPCPRATTRLHWCTQHLPLYARGGERRQAGEGVHLAEARDTVRVGATAASGAGVTPREWEKGPHSGVP